MNAREAKINTNKNNEHYQEIMSIIKEASDNGSCKTKYYIDDYDNKNGNLSRYLIRNLRYLGYNAYVKYDNDYENDYDSKIYVSWC